MLRSAIRFTAYLAIAYLTIGAFLYFRQSRLLFPAPETFERKTPADSGVRFEDLRIAMKAGNHLHAWWIPAVAPTGKVMLVFHGNGYVLEDMVGDELARLRQVGANLMLIDYRGYGSSTPLSPNEKTIDEDAAAALDYLLRDRMIPSGKVFVLGRSIGSGPATHLARSNQRLGGLILESPFSSIDDATAGFWYCRIYPVALILRTHFDNLTKIKSVKAPVLIISGTADTLTPTWTADKLFAQAHQPKQIYMVPGAGHDDLPIVGGVALEQELQRFVQIDGPHS
jgi:pimeloyl-ACP methyl ester carboxylesterase